MGQQLEIVKKKILDVVKNNKESSDLPSKISSGIRDLNIDREMLKGYFYRFISDDSTDSKVTGTVKKITIEDSKFWEDFISKNTKVKMTPHFLGSFTDSIGSLNRATESKFANFCLFVLSVTFIYALISISYQYFVEDKEFSELDFGLTGSLALSGFLGLCFGALSVPTVIKNVGFMPSISVFMKNGKSGLLLLVFAFLSFNFLGSDDGFFGNVKLLFNKAKNLLGIGTSSSSQRKSKSSNKSFLSSFGSIVKWSVLGLLGFSTVAGGLVAYQQLNSQNLQQEGDDLSEEENLNSSK